MISYERFKQVFDNRIFNNSKSDLISKLADNPDRFVGIFRSTTPQEKLIQNISQSHEIRFGDAFEEIIQDVLIVSGHSALEKNILDSSGQRLNIDQLVRALDGEVIFIEQKVRDDHDSTKKVGQAGNFKAKITALQKLYGKDLKRAFVFFIDPSLKKNRNYYEQRVKEFELETGVKCFVFYGEDLFKQLGLSSEWAQLLSFLKRWKSELAPTPDINFDMDPKDSATEILINVSLTQLKKLFINEDIVREIFPVIFPEGSTFRIIRDELKSKIDPKSKQIVALIDAYLK